MNQFYIVPLVVLLLLSTDGFAKVRVVTTLPSFADIARVIGGDEVSVTSLTKGTQDPHFVDARPDLILELNRADLVIRAGLGLEDGWLPPLLTGARNGRIQVGAEGNLDASTLMELRDTRLSPDRSQGDVHPGGNPHFMLDPRNGGILAQAVAKRLGNLSPDKEAYFASRAKQYQAELDLKVKGWKGLLKAIQGKSVVSYHRSWGYFLAWAGLEEAGYVEPKPGIPPSPEHLVTLIRMMKSKHIELLVMEPFYPTGPAEEVSKQTGARMLVLPAEVLGAAEAKSYLELFDFIVQKLVGKS